MYVSLCFVLPPENWSAYLPNKGNSFKKIVDPKAMNVIARWVRKA